MALVQLASEEEVLVYVADLLRKLPFGRELHREVKWRTTEQIANELGQFDRAGIDRIDRILHQHEARSLERLEQNLPAEAVIRRAKYPDRTTALPLWGSVEHHGQPWMGHRPDRTDPPDDIPCSLLVPIGAPQVFLSHTRWDAGLSLRVAEALVPMGIGCWRFETHIGQRGDIADCVREAVRESAGIVALVTRHSVASLWVLTELHTCLQAGGTIILIVDAEDAQLLQLLQSVRFSYPDMDFDLSVKYDSDVLNQLKAEYGDQETISRAERYGLQVHDFLATLPSYLGSVPPGSAKRLWRPALAFPHPPQGWSGTIELDPLQELPRRLETTWNRTS
jgi:TIR domain